MKPYFTTYKISKFWFIEISFIFAKKPNPTPNNELGMVYVDCWVEVTSYTSLKKK